MTRMPFNAFSTSSILFTGYMQPCSNSVTMPATIPVEEMSTGYIWAAQSGRKSGEEAARTRAAQVDSAKDPKRSAPMP